jgi:hypothetical protein
MYPGSRGEVNWRLEDVGLAERQHVQDQSRMLSCQTTWYMSRDWPFCELGMAACPDPRANATVSEV